MQIVLPFTKDEIIEIINGLGCAENESLEINENINRSLRKTLQETLRKEGVEECNL
jgi:hypothetical protein